MSEFSLLLPGPQSPSAAGSVELHPEGSVVIVGANGSGKSRLGAWIEEAMKLTKHVHRIAAQRALTMPSSFSPTNVESAHAEALFGAGGARQLISPLESHAQKDASRWHQKPATTQLNDYPALLKYLASEDYEHAMSYRESMRASGERIPPGESKFGRVTRIWNEVLPHRVLSVDAGKVSASIVGAAPQQPYAGQEMSDGERVVLYLIGECLAALKDSIIIIDEPEIHIHRSIQDSLWSRIERARPDCLFVYMTHDLDFAVSRSDATKIWLKAYDGKTWDWEKLPEVDGSQIPERLLVEILGNRSPVLLVEGEEGSLDVSLFREILPEFRVIPHGGCKQVMEAVKALRKIPQLNNRLVLGLVDRDRRGDTEVEALRKNGIVVLGVAEIENVFCVEEVLQVVCQRMEQDYPVKMLEVSAFVRNSLQMELSTQIAERVRSEIEHAMGKSGIEGKDREEIGRSFDAAVSGIDVGALYDSAEEDLHAALESGQHREVLKVYNGKRELPKRVGPPLGLGEDELPDYVIRLAKGEHRDELRAAILPYLGGLLDLLAAHRTEPHTKDTATA